MAIDYDDGDNSIDDGHEKEPKKREKDVGSGYGVVRVIGTRKGEGGRILTDVVGDSFKVLANDQSHCVCVCCV
jgi:hypothetical protein